MTCVFKRLLFWTNNKHYPVMYSMLFSCLSLLTM